MSTTPVLRAALIVDGFTLPTWAVDAIALALKRNRMKVVAVFVCTNNSPRRNILKHFGYYVIRATLMRPSAFRARSFTDVVEADAETLRFDAETDGAWQRIPQEVLLRARGLGLDVAIKFGMGLLRDPEHFPARFGVLSYHHGDPSAYRGRPAGFYELEADASGVGAVVQRLTNELDGGTILAEGRFRIERHSYRNTLESLYTGASCLLEKALAVCSSSPTRDSRELGKIHRLPTNLRVARFLMALLVRSVCRLAYGAFWRKAWRLFEADISDAGDLVGDVFDNARQIPTPRDTMFLADPFYLDAEGRELVCEQMPKRKTRANIIRIKIDEGCVFPLLGEKSQHFSYPYVLRADGRTFLIPEVAAWSAPQLFEVDVDRNKVLSRVPLQGLEAERLLDPTLLQYNGAFWLFASPERPFRKMDTLLLWWASHLEGPYVPHPMNPVVLDPSSARPGGRILYRGGRLLRYGQDNSAGYGAGLSVMEIQELTPQEYRERQVGRVRLEGWNGPHTIDFSKMKVLADGYRDTFDPLAWAQRIRERM